MKQTIKMMTGIFAVLLFSTTLVSAQAVTFANADNRLNNAVFHSGLCVAVCDVNGDGLDDVVRLSQGHDLYVEYQNPGHNFTTVHIGDFGGGSAWGMSLGDVDHNGYKDVLEGGSGCKLMKIGPAGQLGATVQISTSNFFLQNANFMDVNGDGWEDIFCCDDDAPSHIFLNNGAGGFSASAIINFDITPGQTTGNMNDDSGNYGSVWTDFDNDGDVDLYIAKCRQSYNSPNDNRRWDCLFVNNGSNSYTESSASYNMRDSGQTWTCNFGDIDNDGDLDAIQLDYSAPGVHLKQNDGTGHFTDITAGSGFALTMFQMMQSEMEDFDNDGFIDIIVCGETSEYFHNNHNSTFTEVNGQFDGNNMQTLAIGDVNHDGKVDVYAGYGTIYTNPSGTNDVVWLNTTSNTNNFLCFNLKGTQSNAGALGARATIYGPWGVQIREVRAGDAYGNMSTYMLHFGLGTAATCDSVRINWPSGQTTHIVNPAVNQYIDITEGTCVSIDNVITSTGAMVICAGNTVTLNAVTGAGYSYLWSDGSTGASLTTGVAGEYSVKVTAPGNSCPGYSAVVNLQVSPDETPTVTSAPDLTFCQGNTLVLTSSAATSYQWYLNGIAIAGETGQTLNATQSGVYTDSIQGACQVWGSAATTLTVLAAPTAPTGTGANLMTPGTATISATGTNVNWYDMATAGTLLGTGNNYTTPVLSAATTYYADDENSYGGATGHVGQLNHNGTNFSGNTTNGTLVFDVLAACTLQSVKVYTDNTTYGTRVIELRNSGGTAVLQSYSVDVQADSMVVPVNFNLPVGTALVLTTNQTQNNTSFGYNSPHFMRSDAGVTFPYTLSNLVNVTGSSAAGRFYYFYDWVINEPPTICPSPRTPVTVTFGSGVSTVIGTYGISIFPNPTTDLMNVTLSTNNNNASVEITDLTGKVILSQLISGSSTQMDISNFAAGAYFVNVKNNGNTYKEKLIKQ